MKTGPFTCRSQAALACGALLAACNLGWAQGFYASDQTGLINRISSAGVVIPYATFPGSSDLPEGLALDSHGTLYIANAGQGLLWKIPSGGALTPFVSTGNQIYSYGLTLGPNGNLFAAMVGMNGGSIDQITPEGVVSRYASLPAGAEPFGLDFDTAGNLFVSDPQLRNVYLITPDGSVSIFASLSSGLFPTGLAFDNTGDLLVADFGGSVYRIRPDGFVRTAATLPSNAGLKGLLFDNGDLYVAEQNRNVIGRITFGWSLAEPVISDFAQMHAPQFLVLIPEPTVLALAGVAMLLWLRAVSNRENGVHQPGGSSGSFPLQR
jgi:DNA-binding beta-propeller fold protein YncE